MEKVIVETQEEFEEVVKKIKEKEKCKCKIKKLHTEYKTIVTKEIGIKKEKLICLEFSTKNAITFKEFMKGFEEKLTERR